MSRIPFWHSSINSPTSHLRFPPKWSLGSSYGPLGTGLVMVLDGGLAGDDRRFVEDVVYALCRAPPVVGC